MGLADSALIIDDSEGVRRRVREVLEAAQMFGTIHTAGNGIEGFKFLVTHRIDVVLCDVNMPGMDGFKFLGLMASRPEYVDVPVIMLTGVEDVRSKVRGFEAGAADYLTKPFDDHELIARVRVHLKLKNLQDELKEKNTRLETLSRTDGLTGLFNRRFFNEMMDLEKGRAQRYEMPLALGLVDIDHFKKVNDTYGHLVGDAVLVHVAKDLVASFRAHDMVSRFGGEEFAVLLPHTDKEGAMLAFDRCRQRVGATVVASGDSRIGVTVSIGVATLNTALPGVECETSQNLIARADTALYRAKSEGRNRVILAPSV